MVFGNESTEEDGFDLPVEEESITIELPVPEDAKGIEAFLEEVETVQQEAEIDDIDEEQFNQSWEEPVGTVESDREVDEALEENERAYQETRRHAEEGEMSGKVFAELCVISTQQRMLLNFQKYMLNKGIVK